MFGYELTRATERQYGRGQISVKDPEVAQRLRFQGLTEDDLGVIATWQAVCLKAVEPMIDRFYAHIKGHAVTRDFLHKHTTVERQRPLLTRYVTTMTAGRIDDEYIEYRRKVGRAHDRIGLDFNWYVSMYEIIRQALIGAVREAGATPRELLRFVDALGRLVQTDIALVSAALAEAQQELIEELRARDQVVEFFGEASPVLSQLADRDLTVRIRGSYREDFERIKEALNRAIVNLDDSLTQVAGSAVQVNSASEQISAGSQSLAQGASEQASSLEEISSSLAEVGSMSKQNAANSQEARAMADSARATTQKGMESMRRLSEAIEKIKSSSDETAQIVKTIDEIAFQTNLLALNAAVEAARAGEAGKGFAVVAEEVRSLAQRSAEAARNTTKLISGSVDNAESGVTFNKEVLDNLREISAQVEKFSAVMGEISAASEQQSEGIEQINTGVEQLNQVTQQNAANAEESASASEELSAQAAEMQSLVGSFRLSQRQESQVHPSAGKGRQPVAAKSQKQENRAHPSAGKGRQPVAARKAGAKAGMKPNGRQAPDPAKLIPLDDEDEALLKQF